MDAALSAALEETVGKSLDRFSTQLTRIEVHVGDDNAAKGGAVDKRCQIEARPAGRDPVSVTNSAPTIELAVAGAAKKLQRLLDSLYGRLQQVSR